MGFALLLLSPGAGVEAQNGASFSEWKPSLIPYTFAPRRDCAADWKTSLAGVDLSEITAELREAENGVPPHCRVSGVIRPAIAFQVNLPVRWNGRFYMHGNGGFGGTPPDDPALAPIRKRALDAGFATAYTNTGHDKRREPLATFGSDHRKTLDFAYRAVHLTARVAKQLIQHFYGQDPVHSYWDGCSTGGHQGLVSAQRFPTDFDGIVAGSPVVDWTGIVASWLWNAQALAKTPLTTEKVKLAAKSVYRDCDEIDGLQDGLIEDPRRCELGKTFHLPECAPGTTASDRCFTPGEIETFAKIYQGPQAGDAPLYPGLPVGAEIASANRTMDGRPHTGWEPFVVKEKGRSMQLLMAESFLQYLAFEPERPGDYDWRSFSFEPRPTPIDANAESLNAEPDLSEFQKSGGKMISYVGWADTGVNPERLIRYYEEVEENVKKTPGGETRDFFRLFMIPGMFHCQGGPGADRMDVMTALIEWVEAEKPPERILGTHAPDGIVRFMRPHCPYPKVARYKEKESGPREAADSFECRERNSE